MFSFLGYNHHMLNLRQCVFRYWWSDTDGEDFYTSRQRESHFLGCLVSLRIGLTRRCLKQSQDYVGHNS